MKYLASLVLSGVLSLQLSVAQETSTKLNYDEAVKLTLQNNVNLNQQKNTLFSRQVQRNQGIAAFLPNLNIQGQISRTEGQQNNPVSGALQDITVDYAGASLNASIPLFTGLSRINMLSQTSNQFKAQSALVSRTEQDAISTMTNQYLQVLLDQELLKIARENYEAQRVSLEQIREFVNLGSRAESDLFAQDAQVKNLEVISLRARITLENDKALLAQILQLDPAISFEVTFPDIPDNFLVNQLPPLDTLQQVALNNRQDLKQLQYQVEANKFAYRAVVNGYLPSINLFASYGSQYLSNLNGSFQEQFTNINPQIQYGINFTIPLFDRLQTRNTRVLNRVTYENSILQKENLEKTIKIDVQRAYNNFNAAIESYNAARVQFESGQLSLKTQQESYNLGVSNQVTLALANQTYIQGAASKAQAEVTLIFQKILLDYALGTLKFEDIP